MDGEWREHHDAECAERRLQRGRWTGTSMSLARGFPTGSFDQAGNIELERRIDAGGLTDGLG